MLKILLTLFSALLFLLSLLNVTITENYRLWQLSVVTTEYGHILAFFVLLLFGWIVWKKRELRLAITALFLAFVFFCYPVFSVLRNESKWQAEMPKTLGKSAIVPQMFHFDGLFGLGRTERRSFERIVLPKNGDEELHIDFYKPEGVSEKAPWVFVIHGGGWETGNSEQLPELNWYLASKGYGVAAINYRLLPKNIWPAQKEDAVAALKYMKDHAAELGLDPDRYFVLGRSAGAQIAGVLSYNSDDPGMKGLIMLYPATDLHFGYEAGDEDDLLKSRALVRSLFHGNPYEKPDLYKDASVMEAVKSHPKPTLLLHGFPDRLTWFKHSERLALYLDAKKLPYAFVLMPWATHGFDYNPYGPGGQVSKAAIEYFLREF